MTERDDKSTGDEPEIKDCGSQVEALPSWATNRRYFSIDANGQFQATSIPGSKVCVPGSYLHSHGLFEVGEHLLKTRVPLEISSTTVKDGIETKWVFNLVVEVKPGVINESGIGPVTLSIPTMYGAV